MLSIPALLRGLCSLLRLCSGGGKHLVIVGSNTVGSVSLCSTYFFLMPSDQKAGYHVVRSQRLLPGRWTGDSRDTPSGQCP